MNLAALVMAGIMAMGGMATEATVMGSGEQTVRLMPRTMTMTVNLVATNEQFDAALAAVQQQADDVRKALKGLQAPPAEVKAVGPFRGMVEDQSQEAVLRRQIMISSGRRYGR